MAKLSDAQVKNLRVVRSYGSMINHVTADGARTLCCGKPCEGWDKTLCTSMAVDGPYTRTPQTKPIPTCHRLDADLYESAVEAHKEHLDTVKRQGEAIQAAREEADRRFKEEMAAAFLELAEDVVAYLADTGTEQDVVAEMWPTGSGGKIKATFRGFALEMTLKRP